ncbi:Putative thiol-disulphide oxidoreductase DCC [alpha proteobacterium BAL199]|jgi:predicted DCC family thiol-disulfide oxidoreductase YuxK|nr:Putative thiol-disulphide oxidoreductase DCC [alpha proteobacterium BAL199]
MAKTKVYYNSACPVCAAGIAGQRGKLDACPVDVEWIDVHSDNAAAAEICGDLEFVRERLHVVDAAGRTRVGAEAFEALWALTPGQQGLARISALPIVRPLLRWSYYGVAAILYRWNRLNGRW